jgi:hypothetical protein
LGADTALKWAELLARLHTTRKAMPIKDSLIAATAVIHDLAVATLACASSIHSLVEVSRSLCQPETGFEPENWSVTSFLISQCLLSLDRKR